LIAAWPSDDIRDVTNFLTADFNSDGVVDEQDHSFWQLAYADHEFADANGDGDSDGQDFLAWQRQFGRSLVPLDASQSVPEPVTSVSLALAILGLLTLRVPLCGCCRKKSPSIRAKY
jgi:hypothetical protein